MKEILIATLVAAVSACLFSIGFSYLSGYYSAFDISVQELNPSLQTILVGAGPVALRVLQSNIILIFVMCLAGLLIVYLTRRQSGKSIALVSAYTASIIFLFILGALSIIQAYSLGESLALSGQSELNPYQLSPDERKRLDASLVDHERTELLHIYTTEDTIFLLVYLSDGEDRWVIRLPRNNEIVGTVHIDPQG